MPISFVSARPRSAQGHPRIRHELTHKASAYLRYGVIEQVASYEAIIAGMCVCYSFIRGVFVVGLFQNNAAQELLNGFSKLTADRLP